MQGVGPAVLEPPVLAAVDLHQLADTLAPMAGLVDRLAPLLAVSPNTGRDHPQPQRLAAEHDPVMLPPVLATPVMIMVMENAALSAIRAYLDPGESAVGTAVNVRHLAATPR